MKKSKNMLLILTAGLLLSPFAIAKKGDSHSATIVWKGVVPTANCLNKTLSNHTSLSELKANCSNDFNILEKSNNNQVEIAGSNNKSAMVQFNL